MQQPPGAAAWGTFNTSGTILGTEDLLGSTRRHCLSVCNVIFYSLPTLDLKKNLSILDISIKVLRVSQQVGSTSKLCVSQRN